MWITTAIVSALVLALLTREAFRTGLWCDELLVLRAIDRGPFGGLELPGSSHPPLLRWLLAGASSRWSDGALRTVPVACAVGTVFAWSALLRRLFDDRWLVVLVLPSLVFGAAWFGVAFQLLPYALIALFAVLHAWSWFLLLERRNTLATAIFVGSTLFAAWTHFFGLSIVVADVLVWSALVALRGAPRELLRCAARTTMLTWLGVLPLVPILLFYARTDAAFPLDVPVDALARFALDSRALFDASTLHRLSAGSAGWILLYVVFAILAVHAWRRRAAGDGSAVARVLVLLGACSAALPALQVYSLVTGHTLYERYVSWSGWSHVVAIVFACTLLPRGAGRWCARIVAVGSLAVGLAQFVRGRGAVNYSTQDWSPVIDELVQRRLTGDAFFVQDFDLWRDDANFDRLWFERYGRASLPIVHGAWLRRSEVYSRGLQLDGLDPAVRRVFVFSSLFDGPWLTRMPRSGANGWRLAGMRVFEHQLGLALFVRDADEARPR
ncbi:MAG: hypothetical protein IPJ77_23290 [Planctomycetes bacterium]|nr:hypothetical protein [Planctomycetota bacterium]